MKNFKHISLIAGLVFSASVMSACKKQEVDSKNLRPSIENGMFIDMASLLKRQGGSSSDIIKAEKDLRINVTKGLKEALLNQYSLVHLKEERILARDGQTFNTVAHLDNCIRIEEETDDVSDLHFIDRLMQCIAGFEDTHLGLSPRIDTPSVATGLLIREIDGKYYIHARDATLLNYLKQSGAGDEIDDITAIGNEVLLVDGQSPAQLAKHYEKYSRSSSDGFRKTRADQSIMYRSYDYPTKNFVELVVKSPTKTYHYKLPWWASSNTQDRLDAKEYFQKIGIPTSERVHVLSKSSKSELFKQTEENFDGYAGYFESNPIVEDSVFSPLVEFNSEENDKAARMGVLTEKNKSFCYLQLLTFSAEKLIPTGTAVSDAKSYLDTVKDFVMFCKNKDLDLVMDLRSNNGGYGNYPYEVLSYIAKPDTKLGGKVISYRANQNSARLISTFIAHPELNTGDLTDIDERSLLEIERVLPLNQLMTGTLPVQDAITPDPEVGGYTGKVIGLITPSCISACDGMAALLKRSGRGILIGTHSNGTGAGFMASEYLSPIYEDSYAEISVRIPNYQFGYSSHPFSSLDSFDYQSKANEYFTENMPTVADIQLDTTFEDIVKTKHTWLDAVMEQLQ